MTNERNSRWIAAILTGLLLALARLGNCVPADEPPAFVPLGAYLSWERPPGCAKFYGVEPWTDVCRRLDALQENHFNLLWVTNMAEADLPRLLQECGKRQLRLLPSMSTIEANIDWRWTKGSTYYDKVIPNLLAVAGAADTLAGWVLSDEPRLENLPRVETLRQRFRDLDPNRFCTTVSMWPQTPQVPVRTKLPVVCVDLYPFFGPDDPNGPHTDEASRSFYRRNAASMIAAIGDRNAVGWVMGMCFSDVWGPREFDKGGRLTALPGSYLHWRAPTLAEMRWQVWEAFRSGAKGFICYTLAPETPDPKTATLPPPDVAWKNVLVKAARDAGPNALTNPDGSPTPQLEELGRVFAKLLPHTALLQAWRRHPVPLLEAVSPSDAVPDRRDPAAIRPFAVAVQVFANPTGTRHFAIVVNDDLRREHTVSVRAGEAVTGLTDLITGQKCTLTPDFAGGSSTADIALAAGDGTIVEILQAKPGK